MSFKTWWRQIRYGTVEEQCLRFKCDQWQRRELSGYLMRQCANCGRMEQAVYASAHGHWWMPYNGSHSSSAVKVYPQLFNSSPNREIT